MRWRTSEFEGKILERMDISKLIPSIPSSEAMHIKEALESGIT